MGLFFASISSTRDRSNVRKIIKILEDYFHEKDIKILEKKLILKLSENIITDLDTDRNKTMKNFNEDII